MRFVKPSATLKKGKGSFALIAALALWLASGPAMFVQAKPVPASNAAALEENSTVSAQAAQTKAPAKAAAKAPAPAPAPAKAKAPQKAVAQAKTEAPATPSTSKRDPFQPLISKTEAGKAIPENLPPGPGGLMVSTLRLEGIVRSPGGMIAVVSNPQGRVYFIREGTSLYDGAVEKISMDSMALRERGKDPFGKPVDRQVVKRLYPRAGEQ